MNNDIHKHIPPAIKTIVNVEIDCDIDDDLKKINIKIK